MAVVLQRIKNTVESCLLHRDPQYQVYFSNPQTSKDFYFALKPGSTQIDDQVPVTYNGSPISLDQLDENTEATLTIDKRAIVKVEVTYLRPKKTLFEIYREGFVVFASRKFATHLMIQEYMDAPRQLLAAQTISAKCSGIRKVSSDGGKGFWTAVGLAYFEHLALDVVGEDEFSYFYGLLLNAGIKDSDQIVTFLTEVRNTKYMRQHHKYTDGCEHFQGEIIDRWHNNTDFQNELIKGLKAITFKYVADHPDHEAVEFLESGISGFEIELKHGQETNEVAIAFAACALPIKLVVYSLDSDHLRESYNCDPSHGKLTYIRLLKQYDAYFILYTENWLAIEGYNLFIGRRGRPEQFDQATVMSLYYTPKNDRFQLQGCATKEMYDDALATLSNQAELIHGVEDFIISTFSTLKRRPLPNANLFDNDLLMSTYALKSAYKKLLGQLSTLPPEAGYASNGLRALENSGVLNDLQIIQRCDRCQNAISDAVLKCGHGVCKACFFERVTELRNEKGYIVEPSGEAIRELTCPILDCKDYDQIPTRLLQELLGDQFDAYLEEAERTRMIRKCTRCDKVYEFSKFLLSSCSCKLCVYCQLELMRANFGMCMCGTFFDAMAIAKAGNLMETCQQCRRYLWLWRDFTPVRCSEHVMCIWCLEKTMKDEKYQMKVDPRCPLCYRPFAPYEIEHSKQSFERICDLDCGKFFDISGALDLPCGCHYCEECGAKRAMRSGIQQCYSCKQPFPEQLIAIWERKLKQNAFLNLTIGTAKFNAQTNYQATKCDICTEMIGYAQRFPLTCNHAYHRDCIGQYLHAFVSTIVENEIACPRKECKMVIAPELLQRAANPKDFLKYSELLIKAKEKLISCPVCPGLMYGGNIDFGPNSQVICSYCGNRFCGVCLQQWQDPHDSKRCQFEYIKKMIEMLEQSLPAGESDIAQCPGCKTPYLKDEHCDHMKCAQCQVEWCFSCSCLRIPAKEHSTAWHRPQCRFYNPPDGTDKLSANCTECQRLGRLCDPPPNLKVPRRFDFDE